MHRVLAATGTGFYRKNNQIQPFSTKIQTHQGKNQTAEDNLHSAGDKSSNSGHANDCWTVEEGVRSCICTKRGQNRRNHDLNFSS